MTTLFWLEIAVYGITTVIASSLALTVVGVGPKQGLNRSFALFMLVEAVSAIIRFLFRLDTEFGLGVPLPLMELVALMLVLRGPLLMLFTTFYVGRRTRRTDLIVGLGLAVVFIFGFSLFANRAMSSGSGETTPVFDVETLVSVGTPLFYLLCSLVLFWQERHRVSEPFLALGAILLVVVPVSVILFQMPFVVESVVTVLSIAVIGYLVASRQLFNPLQELTRELERKVQERTQELEMAYAEIEKRVEAQTVELQRETAERERLQQEIIEAQRQALLELSTPVIPMMHTPEGGIIVMPLVGSIDSMRARDIMRKLLAGIREHQAEVVILDVTGVPVLDSAVADHLNRTIQAAQLKGTHTIITGISNAVAETIVDLGIDWEGIETVADLQTGLRMALAMLGWRIER
jgi:anti-anti-sigma regulatory factor